MYLTFRRHNIEFLLPSKARLAEAIKGEDESDEETEGDMIDGLALTTDSQIGKIWRTLEIGTLVISWSLEKILILDIESQTDDISIAKPNYPKLSREKIRAMVRLKEIWPMGWASLQTHKLVRYSSSFTHVSVSSPFRCQTNGLSYVCASFLCWSTPVHRKEVVFSDSL